MCPSDWLCNRSQHGQPPRCLLAAVAGGAQSCSRSALGVASRGALKQSRREGEHYGGMRAALMPAAHFTQAPRPTDPTPTRPTQHKAPRCQHAPGHGCQRWTTCSRRSRWGHAHQARTCGTHTRVGSKGTSRVCTANQGRGYTGLSPWARTQCTVQAARRGRLQSTACMPSSPLGVGCAALAAAASASASPSPCLTCHSDKWTPPTPPLVTPSTAGAEDEQGNSWIAGWSCPTETLDGGPVGVARAAAGMPTPWHSCVLRATGVCGVRGWVREALRSPGGWRERACAWAARQAHLEDFLGPVHAHEAVHLARVHHLKLRLGRGGEEGGEGRGGEGEGRDPSIGWGSGSLVCPGRSTKLV